jgi:hypothetical protein
MIKDVTGSGRGLIYCTTSTEFARGDLETPRGTADRTASGLSGIRTVYLAGERQSFRFLQDAWSCLHPVVKEIIADRQK